MRISYWSSDVCSSDLLDAVEVDDRAVVSHQVEGEARHGSRAGDGERVAQLMAEEAIAGGRTAPEHLGGLVALAVAELCRTGEPRAVVVARDRKSTSLNYSH